MKLWVISTGTFVVYALFETSKWQYLTSTFNGRNLLLTKRKFLKILSLVILFVQIGCEQNVYRTYDRKIEKKLAQQLVQAKRGQIAKISLNDIFIKPWEKTCFQPPYADEAQFENVIGVDVRGYEYLADDFYGIWVIYLDKTQGWAKINRSEVMDRARLRGQGCTHPDSPWIYTTIENGITKYYF